MATQSADPKTAPEDEGGGGYQTEQLGNGFQVEEIVQKTDQECQGRARNDSQNFLAVSRPLLAGIAEREQGQAVG